VNYSDTVTCSYDVKCSINPITNPNPIYSHTHTCDNWCQKWDWIEESSGWSYHQPTKMVQMMEHLVASTEKLDANLDAKQEKMDVNLKEMKAGQKHLNEEMLTKSDAHHKRMMTRMDYSQLQKMVAMVDIF
jgi:hypothetical protein